jgi:hypothetical protein
MNKYYVRIPLQQEWAIVPEWVMLALVGECNFEYYKSEVSSGMSVMIGRYEVRDGGMWLMTGHDTFVFEIDGVGAND